MIVIWKGMCIAAQRFHTLHKPEFFFLFNVRSFHASDIILILLYLYPLCPYTELTQAGFVSMMSTAIAWLIETHKRLKTALESYLNH